MLSNEGPGGFFKGNLSNVYRSVGSSLVLVLYDEFKAWAAKIAHWYFMNIGYIYIYIFLFIY